MIGGLCLCVVAQAADDPPPLTAEKLATPVVTSRMFVSAVAPNPRGGWNLIGQFMNYYGTTDREKRAVDLANGRFYLAFADTKSRPEAEWAIVGLETGQTRIVNWPGFHSTTSCLAGNGRVFFSVDHGHIYYYEPAEETVKPLGRVADDIAELRIFYKLIVGPDGMVYGSSQSTNGVAMLLRLNPDTLDFQVVKDVGLAGRRTGLTYGYYLVADPPWAYVAVGQGNWELFAVNFDTGEKRCLAERTGDRSRIVVSHDGGRCSAALIGLEPKQVVRLVDGVIVPASPDAPAGRPAKPIEWKQTQPMPVENPPELDPARPVAIDGRGQAEAFWRPAKSAGEWRRAAFAIRNAEPAPLESLIALPDGSLLGNAYQYSGFFRYDPATGRLDYFGKHGPSRPRLALVGDRVFIDGYPNTVLYAYDPAKPWTSTAAHAGKDKNPSLLGTMGQGCTEAHHSRFLVDGGNGRVYMAGQRERWSTGTGLGYHDIASGRFFGLGQANKDMNPAGLVALPELGRIVLSGALEPKATAAASLVIYDMDLNEVERIEVRPGLRSGGALFRAEADGHFLGCIQDPETEKFTLYRYDLAGRKVARSVEMPSRVTHVVRRPADGAWFALLGANLARLDPKTLDVPSVGRIEGGLSEPTWVGRNLYGIRGPDLVRVAVP
jgi:hypothetical protein